MPQVDPVILQLRADLADYNRKTAEAVRLAEQRLGAIEQRGDRMAGTLTRGFSLAAGAALSFAASVGGVAAARALGQLADSAKSIEAQLRLATRESGNFAQAQEDVRRISAITRSEIESTAQLYGSFQRNARELGITQEQAARATQTVTQSFRISGASASESSNGVRQLTQALQSGVLRGDEFNSMMENAPRLARLLADSLGMPVGALREMAAEGQLTSDALVRALTDQRFTAGIDEEFRQLPKTFGEAMTLIENAAIVTFGAFDRGGQFSTSIANFVSDGAQGFADMERAAERFGSTVSAEIAGIISAAEQLVGTLQNVANMFGLLSSYGPLGLIERLGQDRITGAARLALDPIGTGIAMAGNKARQQQERRNLERLTNQRINDLMGWDPANPLGTPAPAPRPVVTAGGGSSKKRSGRGGGRRGPSAEQMAERQASELFRLEQDELRARMDLATDVGERADIAKQLLLAEREELVRRLQAQKLLTSEMMATINRIYGEPGKRDPATGEVISEGRPGLLAQEINRDLEERQARLANDMLSRQAETLDAWADLEMNTKRRVELEESALELHQQIQRNLLEQEIASGKVADAERAQAELASQQAAVRERLRRRNMAPGERYLFDLRTSAENVNEAVERIKVEGLETLNDGLVDAIMGVRSLGDVFKSVANQIIADLLRIAVQKSVIEPLANALFGGGSLFGGGGLSGVNYGALTNAANTVRIPGFASGTMNAPRGLALVGERGPELVRFGGGEQVIPNHNLAAAVSGGNVTQHITISVDAQGAVLTSQVQRMVAEGMQAAAQVGMMGGAAEGERRVYNRGRRRIPG